MFNDFISLIFPNKCATCNNNLHNNEKFICSFCFYYFPQTGFHQQEGNVVEKLFYGKTVVHSAASFFYFSKEGRVQQMIHELKYKGHKELGYYLGSIYGQTLKNSERFNKAELIIPVPLHHEKQKKRGYNQSLYFGMGLAEGMGIEVESSVIVRQINSGSQTRKKIYERWENVTEAFELKNAKNLEGKHILLVDDVVTTGATLEACAALLNGIDGIKVSIATIAFAN